MTMCIEYTKKDGVFSACVLGEHSRLLQITCLIIILTPLGLKYIQSRTRPNLPCPNLRLRRIFEGRLWRDKCSFDKESQSSNVSLNHNMLSCFYISMMAYAGLKLCITIK
jgi:hypothetical protein